MHAHGGGIFQENGTFFWYGTTVKLPGGWISEGINLYSSPDLQSWAFEGEIFHDRQIVGVPFDHPYRIERPKVGKEGSLCITTQPLGMCLKALARNDTSFGPC